MTLHLDNAVICDAADTHDIFSQVLFGTCNMHAQTQDV